MDNKKIGEILEQQGLRATKSLAGRFAVSATDNPGREDIAQVLEANQIPFDQVGPYYLTNPEPPPVRYYSIH